MLTKINGTKLLVEDIIETTQTTKGGIILPNAIIKKETMKGKVLIVGKGTPDIEIPYKTGDIVLFHPRAGQKFSYEGDELRLIDCNEVLIGGR